LEFLIPTVENNLFVHGNPQYSNFFGGISRRVRIFSISDCTNKRFECFMKNRYLEGLKVSVHNVRDAYKQFIYSVFPEVSGRELAAPASALLRLDPEHDEPAT
jgi:hypothetical protein